MTKQRLISTDRVIRVQFRSVAENLVCKSVQLINLLWKPWNWNQNKVLLNMKKNKSTHNSKLILSWMHCFCYWFWTNHYRTKNYQNGKKKVHETSFVISNIISYLMHLVFELHRICNCLSKSYTCIQE